jgi:hypothetical protein
MWRSVSWVMWETVTVVEGTPSRGFLRTQWLTGLWSTQAKVEAIVLEAEWHWGNNSSVEN